jgi:hypothetical protein
MESAYSGVVSLLGQSQTVILAEVNSLKKCDRASGSASVEVKTQDIASFIAGQVQ